MRWRSSSREDGLVQMTHLFAGVAVSDFSVACEWYERLFDGPPASLPREGEAVWHLAPSVSIYIRADRGRAGHGLLTIAVKDLEHQRVELARRGLAVEDGAEASGLRTVVVEDPDGGRIKFFEDPVKA